MIGITVFVLTILTLSGAYIFIMRSKPKNESKPKETDLQSINKMQTDPK